MPLCRGGKIVEGARFCSTIGRDEFPRTIRRSFQSAALAGASLAGNPLADAASDAARKGGRIAMINSECRFKSHAYHFGRRFMEGYEREGFHHQPSQAVVRMFKDKHPANELAAADSERFHFERCNSVGDALGGKGKVDVDAVLLVIEHGKCPVNEFGQSLYPRYDTIFQN